MPYLDVGTTRRTRLTPSRRLKVWESTGGQCVLCERMIDPRDGWIAEHVRALELGGADDLTNIGPAHASCANVKTRRDHAQAARAKRVKIRHVGAHRARRPLPCGRGSAFKRTIHGHVIRRVP